LKLSLRCDSLSFHIGHQAAALLEVSNTALSRISVAVPLVIAGWRASGSPTEALAGWDSRLDAFASEPVSDPGGIAGSIASDGVWALPGPYPGPRYRYFACKVGEEG
jgi:hypothetical protein